MTSKFTYYFKKNRFDDNLEGIQFFKSENTLSASQSKDINDRKIVLPKGLNLSQLDVSFLHCASKNTPAEINEQYVLVESTKDVTFDERVMMIYSLNDTTNPVVHFQKGKIPKTVQGFFLQKDEYTVCFSL